MILFLDTSDSVCKMWIDDKSYKWESGRGLAKGLLKYMKDCLAEDGKVFEDLTGLVFMVGPGSYTGLRIGATVMNTLADGLGIAIVGIKGGDWRSEGKKMLGSGKNQRIVLPEYGGVVNITTPKK